ncbi:MULTISPECIES: ABC transporter ATP-binding protein [Brenneria]|uniref:ABC transporter ATP-binding protein n=1 Tax=Brenneria nigrifluens DSM 30175 = ATCC 13028 TaxID=1121120 RepID=A0A2U1UIK4_9GAMM|nr:MULTISPECIES: ABC transporter ATP-binding protein [Brenneria]EHD23331.1 ABC transporter-related protein [Brenneria sp. EniD312]PWC21506.1 ABC transporter ATP-binding protein [Brenneria nigrifluens DSM 30175 = ATCC 13028]QCR06262.1 ABC transporter ATP-binding protein [Brenneria nigrifluens DSM 30175 = ATCC 13028]
MADLLRVEHLQVAADDRTLVDDISFNLRKGEVLGLIGESGAGKSTIGQAILGHCRHGMRIRQGHIWFADSDLAALSERQLRKVRGRRIAYVAQSASAAFNPARRIGEQVIEAAVLHRALTRRQATERALELFARLSLPDPAAFFRRYPHQVSGGQLQRAMIAMALIAGPDLIIFDEPTTALDVTTQLGVLQAIADIIRLTGVAALYISHDLAVVAQLSDRIMVLRGGRQVEIGATAQILAQPTQDYTRQLLLARGEPKAPRPPSDDIVLDIRRVSASYGRQPVLEAVSLQLIRGRTLAVIGESGSGKSTLGRAVCGLLAPENGDVVLQGESLPPRLAQRTRRHFQAVQMIHQHPDTALNPRLTVGVQIERAIACLTDLPVGQRGARVRDLLQRVGLPAALAGRYPGALSGGQKQRVCIARALAAEPELIVCDEPTSALDPLVARDVLALLRQIQRETGVAYLFITHDLHVVREVADSVAVLRHGRIVRQGPVAETLSPPLDDYTRQLLIAVPEMRCGWLREVSAAKA